MDVKNRLEANWKQLRGAVKEQWGELSDDDLDRIDGQRDQLVGKLQERYALAREDAEREVKRFETNGRY